MDSLCTLGRAAPLGRPASRSLTRDSSCKAAVKFALQKKVDFGDQLKIVGSHDTLGQWNVDAGRELAWSDGDVWRGEISLPDNEEIEFKLVTVRGGGGLEWEQGDNHKLSANGSALAVNIDGNSGDMHVQPLDGSSGDNGAGQQAHAAPPPPAHRSYDQSAFASGDDMERLPQSMWQGKQVQFMQENNHDKERRGVWKTEGLEGEVLKIVQEDEKRGSWLQKLDLAKELIVDDSKDMRPTISALAPVYIYLQWITTGSIECVEGGGHYRPNRHAELAKIMFRSLEWVAGGANSTAIERTTARRMQAKLPSFSESFTQSVPLTRIRDIAHRGDIPQDLKKEIKHTLQNKLHRNAGPEDLVAAEAMLERITAHGTDYSGGFVDEFKVFMDELRDFFNAGSLTQMLEAVMPSMDDSSSSVVSRFLESKGLLDGKGQGAGMNDIVDCAHQLTSVRALLVSGLASGLRNDAPDEAMTMRQRWRLADLRCEDYAFVLAARFQNLLEGGEGGAEGLAGAHEKAWALPTGMLVLALRHMGLSGWQPAECGALEEELSTWQKAGLVGSRDNALRTLASLQRAKRLADGYAEAQLQAFAGRAQQLGNALGMPHEISAVFTEAEIRANVAFQLSRLSALLLRACRITLKAADYDALVLGEGAGVLVQARCIEPGMELPKGMPCVLLVDSATGDEEITTAGGDVRGVVLKQDLPHLSHLGVRARQERVPFATCTADDVVAKDLTPLVGKPVCLTVAADGVTITEVDAATLEDAAASRGSGVAKGGASLRSILSGGGKGGGAAGAEAAKVRRVARPRPFDLADADVETSGAKAASCGRLAAIAERRGAPFKAPAGAVLPFGCMEAAIDAASAKRTFQDCLKALETAEVGPALDGACAEVQALIRDKCHPQERTMSQLQRALGSGADVVIARSSANVEDLEGLSGAGLYESIPNLDANDSASLAAGVAEVWASLFSRRAVLSRRAAGIAHTDACMAVLVQEMLAPQTSFVLHSADPLSGTAGESNAASVYAELAPGLGETLASGTEGTAWRMSVDKTSSDVMLHSFANFSEAYLPVTGEARGVQPGSSIYNKSGTTTGDVRSGMVALRTVDYSKQALSTDENLRLRLAQELAQVGVAVEKEFGSAQDVEGAVLDGQVYVVQSRPQP